ncbi:MAG TPA: EAL domain-containing protein [Burkholderiales bacterium]|nr:EAL domain-containing protein [Burkholderiales bacterium]
MNDELLDELGNVLAGWDDPQARLRNALSKDELVLYCQPIRALQGPATHPIAEVLVRLREEESAMLPPGEFLPVFEHYGMMPELDRWVVRSVVKRLARGSKVPGFSVNLSGQTLADAAFPKFVAGELMDARVPPKSLLFEVDESDLLAKPDVVRDFSTALRTIGVQTMADGFGRRAASFAPLKALVPRFIKVDGSITRRVLASETAARKLQAVVKVAEALGVEVIAECVEEQDILLRLKALGVGYVQGFGVYRPHPIDSVAG